MTAADDETPPPPSPRSPAPEEASGGAGGDPVESPGASEIGVGDESRSAPAVGADRSPAETESEPEIESGAASEPEAEPEPEIESGAASEPEAESEPESEPGAASEPTPKAEPDPDPDPEPDPEPEPEAATASEPGAESPARGQGTDGGGAEEQAVAADPERRAAAEDREAPSTEVAEAGAAPEGRLAPSEESASKERAAPFNRRRFLALLGSGAVAAAAAAVAVAIGRSGSVHPPRRRYRPHGAPVTDAVRTVTLASGVSVPVADWVVEENLRPGTLGWQIVNTPGSAMIQGYADAVSVVSGETVGLHVSSTAPTFTVEAYRMGWYQGQGARLVWRSAPAACSAQPTPGPTPRTNMIECSWPLSIVIEVDGSWPPGAYLLKLVNSEGGEAFVPLCVRDDASTAAFLVQHSVTTWQAYNPFGGYSQYFGPGHVSQNRSRVVSFDRPYDYSKAWGASDFIGNELPIVLLVERLGLDVTYWTDIDLHAQPDRLRQHRCLISLGHDEYWSAAMRDGATTARDAGCNLAFLGANACYRHIRLEASPLGPLRRQVCYKTDLEHEDPMWGVDPAEVTANWPDGPDPRPEQSLVGAQYADVGAQADLVIADGSSWVLAGTGLGGGSRLAGLVAGEYDHYVPGLTTTPTDVDLVAHSAVVNRGPGRYSDMTYYTAPGGGGVLDVGTAAFVNMCFGTDSAIPPEVVVPGGKPARFAPTLTRLLENVFSVFGAGPASATHPSTGNWRRTY